MKPEFIVRVRHGGDFPAKDFKSLKLLVNGKLSEKYEGCKILDRD